MRNENTSKRYNGAMMHEVTSLPGCPYVHSNQLKFHSVAVSPLANQRHFPA